MLFSQILEKLDKTLGHLYFSGNMDLLDLYYTGGDCPFL